MVGLHTASRIKLSPGPHDCHRCPTEIFSYRTWWCDVFSLSLRDIAVHSAERVIAASCGARELGRASVNIH